MWPAAKREGLVYVTYYRNPLRIIGGYHSCTKEPRWDYKTPQAFTMTNRAAAASP